MLGIHCQLIRFISPFTSPPIILLFLIMVDILHIMVDILHGEATMVDGEATQGIGLLEVTAIDTTKITKTKVMAS